MSEYTGIMPLDEVKHEMERYRYWLLIDSVVETVSVCCENDQTRKKAFAELYELEEINRELLEAAQKAKELLEWEGMGIEELDKAIAKAKGDDDNSQ